MSLWEIKCAELAWAVDHWYVIAALLVVAVVFAAIERNYGG